MNYKGMNKAELIKELENKPKSTEISNNMFIGVQWDGQAIQGVNDVARALRNLTEVYQAQHIRIDSLLTVKNDEDNLKVASSNTEIDD